MSFKLPDSLVNAGKAVHRSVMKVTLFHAKMNQVVLDAAASPLGKTGLSMIPKYGKLAVLAIDPIRDLHRHALDVHEAVAQGKDPGPLKEHLNRLAGTMKLHLPAIKAAHQEYKATRPIPSGAPAQNLVYV